MAHYCVAGHKEDVKGYFKDPKLRDQAIVELNRREAIMTELASALETH